MLKHPDKRVRTAAFDTLVALQPDRPGGPDAPEAWERWLKRNEDLLGGEEPIWITVGWASPEDILFDIVEVRAKFAPAPKAWILTDQGRHEAVRRLVRYLRHPNQRIRSAAFSTLIRLQEDCPGSPDTPDVWESWLKVLEGSTTKQDGRK